jgi:hypothetical protein
MVMHYARYPACRGITLALVFFNFGHKDHRIKIYIVDEFRNWCMTEDAEKLCKELLKVQ